MNKTVIKALIIGCIISIAMIFAYFLIFSGSQSTDNAYLKSDIILLKPKVTGYIKDVFVKDNQTVNKGTLIAKIDDRDFKLKVDIIKAEIKANEARIAVLKEKIKIQDIEIENSKIKESSIKNSFDLAEKELKRAENLLKDRAASQQEVDKKKESYLNLTNEFSSAKSNTIAAITQKNIATLELQESEIELKKQQANLEIALIDLDYTNIYAAADGKVSTKNLQIGQLAQANTALGYLIIKDIWVIANFKETQITNMKIGQHVKISIDSTKGKTFKGKIDSFSPATGSEFSILPPENATGNFTKIVQRVPVKIIFDDGQDLSNLKPGLSCEVKVIE